MFGLKIPQSIFVHADGFFKASIARTDPPNPYDFSVLVTNCAIACELYLKCLINLETGQRLIKQHNLQKLFAMLPRETQATIRQRFDVMMAANQPTYDHSGASAEVREMVCKVTENLPKNLIEALRKGGDAFAEWRYLYENEDGTGNPFSLFNFPHVLRVFILERKPEWRNFVFKMEKIGSVQPTSPTQ